MAVPKKPGQCLWNLETGERKWALLHARSDPFTQGLKCLCKSTKNTAINGLREVLVMCGLLWECLLLLEKQRQNWDRNYAELTADNSRKGVLTRIFSAFFCKSPHLRCCLKPYAGLQPSCCLSAWCLVPRRVPRADAVWAVEHPSPLKGYHQDAPPQTSHPAESGLQGPDLRWKLSGFS